MAVSNSYKGKGIGSYAHLYKPKWSNALCEDRKELDYRINAFNIKEARKIEGKLSYELFYHTRRNYLGYPDIDGKFPRLLFSLLSGKDFKYSLPFLCATPTPLI